jgi:hypothetical protein
MIKNNNDKVVISLYDYTGVALEPWAKRGYKCYAYDIQHGLKAPDNFDGGGSIYYVKADLHSIMTMACVYENHKNSNVVFAMAFPVCTDLAVSGAAHFKLKAYIDPQFQIKAARHAKRCAVVFEEWAVPYFIENPVSRLATLWRAPDYRFHPFEYGGYIPTDEAEHPLYPSYIAPMDAYSKRTCLWTGGGFTMPVIDAVNCDNFGNSTQHQKLGGKSMKTKNIRSATPRGFAEAIAVANGV